MRYLALSLLKSIRPRGDDDFVDRINYYYTPIILGVCAVVVSAKQYVGQPLQCWVPPQFTTSMEQYIESYCWIQNTYWLPMHHNIPDDLTSREERQIGYYQWVPFILLVEALMFSCPCFVWRLTNWQTGVNLHQLIRSAAELGLAGDASGRQMIIRAIAHNIQDVLDLNSGVINQYATLNNYHNILRETFCQRLKRLLWSFMRKWHRYNGFYITGLYIIVKFMYFINSVMQFFLLNAMLKTQSYSFYGFQVLADLFSGTEWTESGHFPRVTLCDFEVRFLGNLNRYTVQCTLNVNLFNEKVFALVWCWYFLVTTVTCCSFLFWVLNSVISFQRIDFVLKFLRIAASHAHLANYAAMKRLGMRQPRTLFEAPTEVYDRFVEDHLRPDGIFLLRMLSNHVGDVITMEIVKALWQEYRERLSFVWESPALTDNGVKVEPPNSVIVSHPHSLQSHKSQSQSALL